MIQLGKTWWLVTRIVRRIWVRSVSYAVLAGATVLLTPVVAPILPEGTDTRIGASALEDVLGILASSMLAVATFSLSITVSAFAAASTTATPRAARLLQEDRTTQNVLATFVGAFLFGLVGLIALQTDLYDGSGRTLLFAATIGVVIIVVASLLRWISHIMSFGRLDHTLDTVEAATRAAVAARARSPLLGGAPAKGELPGDAEPVRAGQTGYVQYIDMEALSRSVQEGGGTIRLNALPGDFVHAASVLASWSGDSQADADGVRSAFTIGTVRTFDQDPRFGAIVLSEIASRALSPAVNDPGTAIDVIGRLVRSLSDWAPEDGEVHYPSVHVPGLRGADLITDAFRPIARHAAGIIEVQGRLVEALEALARLLPEHYAAPAVLLASEALERAQRAGMLPDELAALRAQVDAVLSSADAAVGAGRS